MPFLRILIGGVILIGAVITFYLSATLTDRFDKLREAPQDNSQWNLAQLEVDYLKLAGATHLAEMAAHEAGGAEASGAERFSPPVGDALDELRKAFDIFYSRVYVLEESKDAEAFLANAELRRNQDGLKMFLHEMVPAMDGPDAGLLAALPRFRSRLDSISTLPRAIALVSVPIRAKLSDGQRLEITNLLKAIALVALVVLIALMLAFATLLLQKSELNRKTQTIARGNERLASTLRASLDAIIVIDDSGQVMDFNGSAENIFGHKRADVIGRPISQVIIPERFRKAHLEGMARFREGRQSKIVDTGRLNLLALHADGSEFQTETSITAVPGENGLNFIAYIRDITEEVANRQELHAARDSALEAYREKSKFFAVMSHEMRTPLNGIISSLDLMRDTDLTERQRHFLQIANDSSDILLGHINDVLDIAKIESEGRQSRLEPVDLPALMSSLTENLRSLADRRNTRIGWEAIGLDAPYVCCDPRGIRQVLLNLMSNAIKFTSSGQVDLRVMAGPGQTDGHCQLTFSVTDTGIGISAEDQKRIFDDFVTVDNTYERTSTGTGLGLGIARRLVAAMGGRLVVESRPRKGSTFSFTIEVPKAKAGQTPDDLTPAETLAPIIPRRVLVVEDNEVNRELLHVTLTGDGHTVALASDGFEGVHMAAKHPYDVILMDISMPNMDGVKATRMIRESRGLSSATPIYAVTAHAMPEERAKFDKAGMEGCLIKPLRRADLRKMMANIHRAGHEATETAAAMPPIDLAQFGDVGSLLGPDKFRDQLAKFQSEGDTLTHEIRAEIARGNLRAARALTHRLAGSCATFGAMRLHSDLKSLETACKAGDSDSAEKIADGLDPVWLLTKDAIASA